MFTDSASFERGVRDTLMLGWIPVVNDMAKSDIRLGVLGMTYKIHEHLEHGQRILMNILLIN